LNPFALRNTGKCHIENTRFRLFRLRSACRLDRVRIGNYPSVLYRYVQLVDVFISISMRIEAVQSRQTRPTRVSLNIYISWLPNAVIVQVEPRNPYSTIGDTYLKPTTSQGLSYLAVIWDEGRSGSRTSFSFLDPLPNPTRFALKLAASIHSDASSWESPCDRHLDDLR
jgi:hypothetical protein